MRGGTLAARWLKAQGVTHVFALCGEHVLPILDGCEEAGITVIGTRHEQAAVLAAEAHAKVTGRPGVAVVTAGPGVTNAVTGLAVANTSGSPVMLLSGRTSVNKRYTGTFQDIDGGAVVRAVTKFAECCYETERIPYFLETAWRRMVGGRPGAVLLEIPHDVLKADADVPEPKAMTLPEPAGGSPDAIRRAVQMLAEAERPVVIAGSGAWWSGATDALRAFIERTRIPFTSTNAARGMVPDDHDVSLGPMSQAGPTLLQADVVLLAGTKLDASVTFGGPPLFTGNEKLIQVDIEPLSIGLNRTPDLAVHGDARVVLEQLTEAWDGKPKDEWLAQSKEMAGNMQVLWRTTIEQDGSPVPPGRIAAEVIKAAARDAVLVSDGGDIHTWNVTALQVYEPGTFLATHDALGTIGVGVPYALGAKAAKPDKDVICIIGDGSFGFGAIELETAARHDLPIVVVVANNGAWGNIRFEQSRQFSTTDATNLTVGGYEKIAEAFGGYAERVEDSAEVGPAIRRALDSGKPAVVNVILQQGVVSNITQMLREMMTML